MTGAGSQQLNMRFELGSPPRLLGLIGVILILFVIGVGHASALLGWLLVLAVLLIIGSLVWSFRSRRV